MDTHALLWWGFNDPRLSARAVEAIQDSGVVVYSVASLWETGVKAALGRFDFELSSDWHVRLCGRADEYQIAECRITPEHCRKVQDLPKLHGDPFDRMLVAQAEVEGLQIVSADGVLDRYGVVRIW